jgi:hypothetical protein
MKPWERYSDSASTQQNDGPWSKYSDVSSSAPVEDKPKSSPMDWLKGAGETALQLGTGAVAAPLAGLSGIATGGNANVVGRVQDAMTYQPRTQAGQDISSTIAIPFEKLVRLSILPCNLPLLY